MTSHPRHAGFLVDAALASRLLRSPGAIVLLGSFDGSGNFGDVVQLLAAVRLVRGSGSDLPVVLFVEWEYRDRWRELVEQSADLRDVGVAYFVDGEIPNGTVEAGLDRLPDRLLFFFLGGGYVNSMWAARRAAMFHTARGLAGGDAYVRIVAGGLQLDRGGWPMLEILAGASTIGARDAESFEVARELFGHVACFSGDDALALLFESSRDDESVATAPTGAVNVHVSFAEYVTASAELRRTLLLGLVDRICERFPVDRINVIVAFSDARVGEADLADELRAEFAELPATAGASVEIVGALGRFLAGHYPLPAADVCITSSYHVALASMVAEVPTLFTHDGDYYGQKARGLAELFDLPLAMIVGTHDPIDIAVAACDDIMRRPESRERFRAAIRSGIASSLAGRVHNERRMLREILHLDGGAGWERTALLGREYAAAIREVADLRMRNAELLRAARSLAATHSH